MAKKKYTFDIHVEDTGVIDLFSGIKADSYKEASETAKKKFMKKYWNEKRLKTSMLDKKENI